MLAGGASAVRAQPTPPAAQAAAPFDVLFLRNEANRSAYEFAIAQLAAQRATRAPVQAYAATVVNDHAAYNEGLRALAARKGITLPEGLTAQDQARVDRLAAMKGAAFDGAFIREARRVNAEEIRAFRAEASRTADPDLRAFVAQFLPVDQKHEAAARALTRGRANTDSRMPVIVPPPTAGANMPVIKPPTNSPMPVIPPPPAAK